MREFLIVPLLLLSVSTFGEEWCEGDKLSPAIHHAAVNFPNDMEFKVKLQDFAGDTFNSGMAGVHIDIYSKEGAPLNFKDDYPHVFLPTEGLKRVLGPVNYDFVVPGAIHGLALEESILISDLVSLEIGRVIQVFAVDGCGNFSTPTVLQVVENPDYDADDVDVEEGTLPKILKLVGASEIISDQN